MLIYDLVYFAVRKTIKVNSHLRFFTPFDVPLRFLR